MGWVAVLPADFTAWHDARCIELGIPKPGRNAKSRRVNVDAEWTTSWVQPSHRVTIGRDTYYAVRLPDGEPAPPGALPIGLTVDLEAGTVTVTRDGKTHTATRAEVDVARPKPDSIVVDGVTYTRKVRSGELRSAPHLR